MTETPEPTGHSPDAETSEKNARLGKVFVTVVVAMFLAGFASIPLYRMVCAKIDPGGSSWQNGDPDVYEGVEVDESRTIRVRFNTGVERQLPWEFDVDQRYVDVHPGEKNTVDFVALNEADHETVGKAVYDISPPEAAPYFKKRECFCFIEQTMAAGQEVDMPLVYWFDPDMPDHIDEIYLGYTFFNAESSRARAAAE